MVLPGVGKKLLFLVTEDWYFVSHRLHLALAARRAGYNVVVATRLASHGNLFRAVGLLPISLEMSRGAYGPLADLRALWRIWRIYRNEQPDIVHHVALKSVLLGGLAARLAGVRRTVAAVAGLGYLYSGAGRAPLLASLLRMVMPFLVGSGRVIAQNLDDANLLTTWGVPKAQIRLIRGSGVDIRRFMPCPEPDGIPLVLLHARMLWDKGVGEFVEAARLLKRQGPPVRFVLVGGPDPANPASVPETTLRAWVDEGVVEWWGQREDIPAVLAACSIVCLPSYREGLPTSLIEAAACGRPIVTTNAPGCREVVRDGDNGFLVPGRDAPALAQALKRLLSNPALRVRMGARSRERAEAEFAEARIVAETMAVYEELLS